MTKFHENIWENVEVMLHNGFRNGYLNFRLINGQFMGGVYIHVSTPLYNQLAVCTYDIMW